MWPAGNVMCEDDGSLLVLANARVLRDKPEEQPCPGCGASVSLREQTGTCRKCGADWSLPKQDRLEIELDANLAAVTDRGDPNHHRVNQDAVWIMRGTAGGKPYAVFGVGDGVSGAYLSQFASSLAVWRSCISTAQAMENGGTDVASILRAALAEGSEAVRFLPYDSDAKGERGQSLSPAATTIVVAVWWGDEVVFASIGDSRGYAGQPAAFVQYTKDDSWLQGALDMGIPEDKAMAHPSAHAITRWVGSRPNVTDDAPFEPNVTFVRVEAGTHVIVVSDGVWGYIPHIEQFNALVDGPRTEGESALEICRLLVDHALQNGGEDNASAVVFRVS